MTDACVDSCVSRTDTYNPRRDSGMQVGDICRPVVRFGSVPNPKGAEGPGSTAQTWTPPTGSWASSEAIRKTMLGCRSRDTKPEVALRSAVHRLGLRFRVAGSPLPGVRRTADLVFPRAKVAVFLDGCFWHGCPDHYVPPSTNADYWSTKIGGNCARDANTDARLYSAGWAVVRVWEHENPSEAAERISRLVRERRRPGGR